MQFFNPNSDLEIYRGNLPHWHHTGVKVQLEKIRNYIKENPLLWRREAK
jgi:hypothetical protein